LYRCGVVHSPLKSFSNISHSRAGIPVKYYNMFPSSNRIASHVFGGQQQHVQQIFQKSPIQRPETSIGLMQGMGAMGRSGTTSFGMGTQHMRFGTLQVGLNTGVFSSGMQVPTSPLYVNIGRRRHKESICQPRKVCNLFNSKANIPKPSTNPRSDSTVHQSATVRQPAAVCQPKYLAEPCA